MSSGFKKRAAMWFFQQGLRHGRQDKLKEAVDDFSQAFELATDDQMRADASYNRGLAYEKQREFKRARESYEQAVKYRPDFANAHCNLGNMHIKLGEYDKALNSLNRAIALNPTDMLAYFNRAIAYQGLKDYDRTVRDLEIYLSAPPPGHPFVEVARKTLMKYKRQQGMEES